MFDGDGDVLGQFSRGMQGDLLGLMDGKFLIWALGYLMVSRLCSSWVVHWGSCLAIP
jgi:hypothetical protein